MSPSPRRERLDAAAVGLMVLLCAVWGLQQICVKVAAQQGVPPVLQAGGRSIVASLLLLAWTTWRDGGSRTAALLRPDRSLRDGMLLGGLFTLEFAVLYPGLALTSASRGVLFLYTAPFFTALGAHLLLPAERLDARKWLGLAVAFAGVAVAFATGLAKGEGNLLGDALCVLGAMLWAASTLRIKTSPILGRTPATKVLLYQIGMCGPLLLALSAGLGEWQGLAVPSGLAWLCLFYQAVVVAFASYLTWFWLVLRYPASQLAPFTFLTPLFGIVFSGLLLGDAVGLPLVLGVAAIAVGLRLLSSRA